MIRINRDKGPVIATAEAEIEKAKQFFTNKENYDGEKKLTKKSFDFRVYKHKDMDAALRKVFGTICAYCEIDFKGATPKDVEHYRPKSEIDAKPQPMCPGYYWLAGDWDNLLASCPDCNRVRNHEVATESKGMSMGKGTQFPLSDEKYRVRDPGDKIVKEEPGRLLLNPCLDEPELHLTFDEEGNIFARPDENGIPSPKGVASIRVYALQRAELVQKRIEVAGLFISRIVALKNLIKGHANYKQLGAPDEMIKDQEQQITAAKDDIGLFYQSGKPFRGMLRDLLRKRKESGDLANIENFGIDLVALI